MAKVIAGARELDVEALRLDAARAARGLEALGVGRLDTVALMLRNDFAFFEASIAAGLLGAYPVPVNWHYTGEEAGYVVADCGAKVLVIHADLLAGVSADLPAGVEVLVVETGEDIRRAYGLPPEACAPPAGATLWSDWLAGFEPLAPREVQAPGTMIYTSGTTGRPKGVRRKPPAPEQAEAFTAVLLQVFGLEPGCTTVMTGPMYHSAPNAYGMTAVNLDCTTILQPRFDPEELLGLIERHRVTHLHMVPTMFVRLLKLPEDVKQRYDLSSLRFVVHAAAPCPPDVKRRMIEWWGPVIHEYYGATETSAVVFCDSAEWLAHPGTVGRALPHAVVEVLDDAGRPLPRGETGEIACRLKTLADFTYHGDDAKRADAGRGDLVAPGDVGYFDADGFLFISDRRKDMVISGGVNIYPAEIEAVLIDMPGVHDCAVFGIPDEEFGESLCAVVQPRPMRLWTRRACATGCADTSPATRYRSASSSRRNCRARTRGRSSSASCASPSGRAWNDGSECRADGTWREEKHHGLCRGTHGSRRRFAHHGTAGDDPGVPARGAPRSLPGTREQDRGDDALGAGGGREAGRPRIPRGGRGTAAAAQEPHGPRGLPPRGPGPGSGPLRLREPARVHHRCARQLRSGARGGQR